MLIELNDKDDSLMLMVVSPAKNLDFDSSAPTSAFTQPELMQKTKDLVEQCKTLAPSDLSSLMKISDKLAILNAERFNSFSMPFTQENAKQAMFAFDGDVYAGLDAKSLSDDDIKFAQDHLRILSGLYGVLKPLDLMQPYRLEMGTKLANKEGKNLYEFWGLSITEKLTEVLQRQSQAVLLNLASNEYFSAVKKKSLSASIVTPHFKDEKNGQYKIISFFAKKARGLMARFVIQNRVSTVEQLKTFDVAGYRFDEQASTESDLVFTRSESALQAYKNSSK